MKGKPNVGELLSSEVNLFSMCVHVHTYNGGYNVPKYMYNYTNFIKIKFTYDERIEEMKVKVTVTCHKEFCEILVFVPLQLK